MRFWLHPTSLQRKFPNGWRVLNQTCFNSPSDLTQSRKSMDSLTQTSLLQPIRFDANPKVGGEFVQDTIRSFHIFNQHLSSCLRARLKRIHPAFTIPRLPEPAPLHECTDPATAERLGLDRRQMRDTIACSDGKGCLGLIYP